MGCCFEDSPRDRGQRLRDRFATLPIRGQELAQLLDSWISPGRILGQDSVQDLLQVPWDAWVL